MKVTSINIVNRIVPLSRYALGAGIARKIHEQVQYDVTIDLESYIHHKIQTEVSYKVLNKIKESI